MPPKRCIKVGCYENVLSVAVELFFGSADVSGAEDCLLCGRLASSGTYAIFCNGFPRQVVAGALHTCAILVQNVTKCWGWGLYGQLGNGDSTNIGDDEHEILGRHSSACGIATPCYSRFVHGISVRFYLEQLS